MGGTLTRSHGVSATVTRTTAPSRIFAALEGCYEADRAAALAGVPRRTVYDWAQKGVVVPSVSPERPKRWSYADLMALRLVYWLRHPKPHAAPSAMSEVRRALEELDAIGLDVWSADYDGPPSPLRVDKQGRIFVVTEHGLETTRREGVFEETLDLLGVFETTEGLGPDLVRPRPHLRIVPGKLSGEPHVQATRVTTQALAALARREFSVERIAELYPDIDRTSIEEAVDLERQLAA